MSAYGFGLDKAEIRAQFIGASATDLPTGLTTKDVSSSGTPVFSFPSVAGGCFRSAHDNTDEIQSIGLFGGDSLWLDPTKSPVFYARVRVNIASGSAFSADQRLVFGLASAYNGTLDSVATNAWFRLEGANNNILWETDDGTTDDDDNDTLEDWTDGTFQDFKIDMSDRARTIFSIDGAEVATADLSALTSSNLLQPFLILQKDAGTETDSFDVAKLYVGYGLED